MVPNELRGDGQAISPVLDPGLWIPPVPFRREGDTCKGVSILGCRRQYIDPATQYDAKPPKGLRATPSLCREAACPSGQSHHFLHSRETTVSTSTGTFSRISSPALTIAASVFSETPLASPSAPSMRNRSG